jgi:AraC family transcriptional regulator, alkane utilization regulator
MDVLSDVLGVMRLSAAVFFTAEFSAPWALRSPNPELLAPLVLPQAECVSLFHILLDGECFIAYDTHAAVRLAPGDILVFPHGDSHTMRSTDAAATTRLEYVLSRAAPDALPRVSLGGGGRTSRFICGYLNCDQRFAPLFATLPTMLLVRAGNRYATIEALGRGGERAAPVPHGSSAWLETTLRFTVSEANSARPGNDAMLRRLTELMFVEIIREYMQQLPQGERGWLAGLKDPHVGKALHLLHADPMRNWTVDELAHQVAMSRSALAQRFTRLIGEAPIRYLANWRMQLAKQMLRDGAGDSIQAVATRVGYESEPAFNRAFKRATGSPPAAWRKHGRKHPPRQPVSKV